MITNSNGGVVIERPLTIAPRITPAQPVPPEADVPDGRVPRIARLVALAIRFDQLLREGEIRNMAEIARVGQVTRARVTQVLNLLFLAPKIIDEILHLPLITTGRDPISEHMLRPIAAEPDWSAQMAMWRALKEQRL